MRGELREEGTVNKIGVHFGMENLFLPGPPPPLWKRSTVNEGLTVVTARVSSSWVGSEDVRNPAPTGNHSTAFSQNIPFLIALT